MNKKKISQIFLRALCSSKMGNNYPSVKNIYSRVPLDLGVH